MYTERSTNEQRRQRQAAEFPLIPSIPEKIHTLNNRCGRSSGCCRENPAVLNDLSRAEKLTMREDEEEEEGWALNGKTLDHPQPFCRVRSLKTRQRFFKNSP